MTEVDVVNSAPVDMTTIPRCMRMAQCSFPLNSLTAGMEICYPSIPNVSPLNYSGFFFHLLPSHVLKVIDFLRKSFFTGFLKASQTSS